MLLELFAGRRELLHEPYGVEWIDPLSGARVSPYKGVPWFLLGLTWQAYSWNMLVPKW